MYANEISAYLQSKLPEMLSLLENLVDRNTSSDYKPGIDEAGQLLGEEFQKIGYDIEILKHKNVGNGVIARKKGQ